MYVPLYDNSKSRSKMNEKSIEAPTFLKTFFAYLSKVEKNIGARAYVPYLLILILGLPFALVYGLPELFELDFRNADAYSILSSVILVGGILSAFSISASSQVQQIASRYPFSDYLVENDLFEYFIFIPQFTLVVQSLLVLSGAFSILLIYMYDEVINVAILLNISLMMYVFIKTLGLVDLIRVLTWHSARYNIMLNQMKSRVDGG